MDYAKVLVRKLELPQARPRSITIMVVHDAMWIFLCILYAHHEETMKWQSSMSVKTNTGSSVAIL